MPCENHKYLVIGKNSQIVKSLDLSEDFHIVSHTEVKNLSLEKYQKIYIFSWGKNTHFIDEILILVNVEKIVFISTIASLIPLNHRKLYSYPMQKSIYEKRILFGGGTVVRLGIFEQNVKYSGYYPITSVGHIQNFLKSACHPENACKEYNLIEFNYVEKSHPVKVWNITILDMLLNMPMFYFLVSAILRALNLGIFGYTYLVCFHIFSKKLNIGSGVVGTHHFKQIHAKSFFSDIELQNNGFESTLVGRKDNGLKKFWHGVKIVSDKENAKYIKSVPVINNRLSSPALYLHFLKFEETQDNLIQVTSLDKDGNHVKQYCDKLNLAIGALSHAKIISKLIQSEIFLNDHTLIIAKTADTSLDHDTIHIGKLLLLRKKVHFCEINKQRVMIEMRPSAGEKFTSRDYINTTHVILKKLIKRMDVHSFNQAFYNKFGIGLNFQKFEIVFQVENKNCITVFPNGDVVKNAILPDGLLNAVVSQYPQLFNYEKFEAQHLYWVSSEICKNKYGNVKFFGSPMEKDPGASHHTGFQL